MKIFHRRVNRAPDGSFLCSEKSFVFSRQYIFLLFFLVNIFLLFFSHQYIFLLFFSRQYIFLLFFSHQYIFLLFFSHQYIFLLFFSHQYIFLLYLPLTSFPLLFSFFSSPLFLSLSSPSLFSLSLPPFSSLSLSSLSSPSLPLSLSLFLPSPGTLLYKKLSKINDWDTINPALVQNFLMIYLLGERRNRFVFIKYYTIII